MLIQAIYMRGLREEKSTGRALLYNFLLRNKTDLKSNFHGSFDSLAEGWLSMSGSAQQKNELAPTTVPITWQPNWQSGEHPLVMVTQMFPDPGPYK